MRTLRKTILQNAGATIPEDSLRFLRDGYVITPSQYNEIITDKIQRVRSRKGCSQFITALLSKFRSDLKHETCLYPSKVLMNELFMFGLDVGTYHNDPKLNYWGDFRKNESVTLGTPIRYRGYYKRNIFPGRDQKVMHIFEWRKNKNMNVISVYSHVSQDTLSLLARKLFTPCKCSIEQEKEALSLRFEEAFYVNNAGG